MTRRKRSGISRPTPGQIDIIEMAMLEGEGGPMTESRVGFDCDGLEMKVRHDFAAKVLDYPGPVPKRLTADSPTGD